jgi:2-methylisocitrate lyase-like PEP mutase family enzyme
MILVPTARGADVSRGFDRDLSGMKRYGMANQQTKAKQFRSLHVAGNPVVLYNVWDPGSAKTVASAGAKAVATSSWAVAESLGLSDGEQIPFELVIDNLKRIVRVTELPVTVDLESGYGVDAEAVGSNIALAIEAGSVGCNLEDSYPSTGKLRNVNDQVLRIRSAKQAADAANVDYFINARCDVFFQGLPAERNSVLVREAIDRAHLYAQAGASGLFLPGLNDVALIAQITKASPLPVNILVGASGPTVTELAGNGVARISYGSSPYADTMEAFEGAARKAYS